jgi:hypothetical protein
VPRNRAGAALLEVMVALVILVASGAAAMGAAHTALAAEQRAAVREAELLDGERLLTALVLLRRADLDQRLGVRSAGPWWVQILRPEPTIYRISLARETHPDHAVLVTLVHRPEPAP